jgi:pSer/pThr/pTyr-binding forkhead associated (FHA) protein
VYVKSKRIRRHHLNDGDVVVLGKHEIMYMDERSARARAQHHETTGDYPALEDSEDSPEDSDDDAPAAGSA